MTDRERAEQYIAIFAIAVIVGFLAAAGGR